MAKPVGRRPSPDNGKQVGERQCSPSRLVPVRRAKIRQGGEAERKLAEKGRSVPRGQGGNGKSGADGNAKCAHKQNGRGGGGGGKGGSSAATSSLFTVKPY